MKNSRSAHHITPAQRGQIVQRVIVDGWSSAQAARRYGVPTRFVDGWVADFRKYGMASLRQDHGATRAGEMIEAAFSRPLRTMIRRISAVWRGFSRQEPAVQPLPLRGIREDNPR